MAFFTEDFLHFFIELAPNNNKDWFDLNRKRYESGVKKPFADFVGHMLQKLSVHNKSFKDLSPADCIFRINRDIRFSKDKTPYKMTTSAVLAPNGKKSLAVNGIYFELGPESVNVYAGVYEADKDQVLDIREGIAANQKEFKKLITDPKFTELFGEVLGEKNKIIPSDLKAAAAQQPLIFNKQWYFKATFEPGIVLDDNLDGILENCFLVAKPLEQFFNKFIHRT